MIFSHEKLEVINNISIIVFVVIGLIEAIIMAIIFNNYIEPKIEQRLGVKLQYMSVWRALPIAGYFSFRHTELVMYICMAYTYWKRRGKPIIPNQPWLCLYKANYKIEEASKSEIICSFISMMNAFVIIACIIVGSLAMHWMK